MSEFFGWAKLVIGCFLAVALASFSFGLMYAIIKWSVRLGASVL